MDKNKIIGTALVLSGVMSLLAAFLCKNFLPPQNATPLAYLLGLVGLLEIVIGVMFGLPRNR